MKKRGSGTRASGFIIAICVLGGVAAGIALGEPSIGFLVGIALGVLIALTLWLADQRRT